jgi:outer membrane protein OmpA-like peptidoglycan-associated protein/tetratricopeptide (TPR) repeat protein
MKKIILFTFILASGINLFAQGGRLAKANDLFGKLAYAEAIPYFESVCNTEQDSPEMREKLAYCYLSTHNLLKAESEYRSVVAKNPSADNHYWLAYTLMSLDKYQEAQTHMTQFAAMNPSDSRAQLWEKQQNFLAQLQNEPAYFQWKEVAINTDHADFGVYPYPLKNSAVTISSRKKTGFGDLRWAGNNDFYLELFYVQTREDGYLSQPIQLNRPLNSTKHEGPLCFSADGKLVYFTSNNRNEQNKQGKDGIQHLKIYIADIVRSEWLNIREFTFNSADYACGHPTLSPDGKTLYFTSDMPGGFGGADIYSCQINAKGEFEKPVNLGANVNTSGQEMFPWIGSDELLYFSSNGRPGIGGLDLFAAPRDGKMAAKNLGLSINSVNDDFAVTFLADGKSGFIASNRNGTDDIFSIRKLLDIKFNALIKGTVIDQNSGTVLANALLTIKDQNGNIVATTQADANGNYQFEVTPGANYSISAKLDKYDGKIADLSVPMNASTIEQKLGLVKQIDFGIRLLVTDAATKTALSGVGVVITDLKNNSTLINEDTKSSGDVSKQLKGYKKGDLLTLKIELSAPGYLKKLVEYKGTIDQAGLIQLHEKLNVELQAVAVGGDLAKTLGIKPIYFDLGKFNIRKDAAIELDKIVKVMNENPTMVIELGSHTDCRSSVQFNQTLSANRAKASAEYIQKRISNPSRIYGKGYGESKLLNDCGCEGTVKSNCSEEQHQLNRRTEFIIIKM